MQEGWFGEHYFVLFDSEESAEATRRYRVAEILPDHVVVGLRGWDDLVVRDRVGATYTVPAVSMNRGRRTAFAIPVAPTLVPDGRLTGKIKWYLKPLVFGGRPDDEANIVWVSHQQHGDLVVWWNAKYQELTGGGAEA
jgi:hypothetical protein